MQFAVPQFTEAEDKLIGPLTLKQFLILFFAGLFIVLIYSATKNALIAFIIGLPVGLPALIVAFVPYNGRSMYNILPRLVKNELAQKVFVFRKESLATIGDVQGNIAVTEKSKATDVSLEAEPSSRLKQLHYLLEQKQREEQEAVQALKGKPKT
jgi:hypothetical protein